MSSLKRLKKSYIRCPRFESEVKQIRLQMESISGVYDDLNEKMHDVDKSMYVVQQAILERV
jgi:hypothetical protein